MVNQVNTINSAESPKRAPKMMTTVTTQPQSMMMFETSDKHHIAYVARSQLEVRISQVEEREEELKKQEQDLLASKEKVFAKWQEYIEKSEQFEVKEAEVRRLLDQIAMQEAELDLKAS